MAVARVDSSITRTTPATTDCLEVSPAALAALAALAAGAGAVVGLAAATERRGTRTGFNLFFFPRPLLRTAASSFPTMAFPTAARRQPLRGRSIKSAPMTPPLLPTPPAFLSSAPSPVELCCMPAKSMPRKRSFTGSTAAADDDDADNDDEEDTSDESEKAGEE